MKKITLAIALFTMSSYNVSCKETKALFSPAGKPTKTLIDIINNAKKSIHAAVYMLTDKTVADALINKAKTAKNVDIKIILDPVSTDRRFGKAEYLSQNNIPVFVFDIDKALAKKDSPSDKSWFDPIMHNKFMIVDGVTLWTGSFNWTVSANTTNCENVIIIDDRTICKQYETYFAELLTTKCKSYQLTTQKNTPESSLRESIKEALANSFNDETLLEQLYNLVQIHKIADSPMPN